MQNLFTVGYSGHDQRSFTSILLDSNIDVICDVRSTPYSRYKPEFSRAPLKKILNDVGMKYVFLGGQLGARPADRSCYVNGQATYQRIAKSEFFAAGLHRVRSGAKRLNLALMCSESDPIECHRAILVCRELNDMQERICHIRGDGSVETQAELDRRLLDLFKLTPPPLLSDAADWAKAVEQAYSKQGDAIAFREKYPN